jgi:uncharacterized membrane protein YcaP (DUF421 family)
MLVHDGAIIASHMAMENVSYDELERALREHGVSDVHDVAIAVLEVDGAISVVRREDFKPGAEPHPRGKVYLRKH